MVAAALGLTSATEPYLGTSLLTPHLRGNVGLIFSPRSPTDILAYFANFNPADFARAGTIASRTFAIPSGLVYSRGGEIPEEEDLPLAHSLEPNLRKLGVPTKLVKGKVMLESEEPFVVCTEKQKLGSGQTSLLKMFGVATAEFRVRISAWWERETGLVTDHEDGESSIRHAEAGAEVEMGTLSSDESGM